MLRVSMKESDSLVWVGMADGAEGGVGDWQKKWTDDGYQQTCRENLI